MKRVAILGAGVMGAQIAALLAGAGLAVDLLDLSREAAAAGCDRLRTLKPSPLYAAADLAAIRPRSLTEPLPPADWYIEAVVEDLAVKRELLARVEAEGSAHALVSTNTSSLTVTSLAAGRGPDFRRRFLGTHFFNPPRYTPLVEVIASADTSPAAVATVQRLLQRRLGKRCVLAHDVPGFIANRVGGSAIAAVLAAVTASDVGVDEADAITGPPLGRPRSATFRTLDLVGLDTLQRIAGDALPDWVREMIRRGWLGEKSGQGFYKREGGEVLVVDPRTLTYRPRRRLQLPDRPEELVWADTREGRFAWAALAPLLRAAAAAIPEAADEVPSVDNAMRWGYNWSLGPFQLWDRIGFRRAAERLLAGGPLPPLAASLYDQGAAGFYAADDRVWSGTWHAVRRDGRAIDPLALPAVWETPDASLRDLGDDVALLLLHPDRDAIGPGATAAIRRAADEVGGGDRWSALVLAGAKPDRFSVGANLALLLFAAEEGDWDEIARQLQAFQQVGLDLRHIDRPVVVAAAGLTLGAGCELCLAADRVQAAAETAMGLPELGVGLIPAGGGCTAMVRRAGGNVRRLAAAFEAIGQARVAESARAARELGYLTERDGISLDAAHRLADARDAARLLWEQGYAPPRADEAIPVVGRDGRAVLELAVYDLECAGRITAYDAVLARTLAGVLAGGDLPAGTAVSASYLLELEREAFLRLAADPRSQARMAALLRTGRPLRN
jgi:3-hydroxyacyl-CoA dehydrogenase